MTDQYSSQSQGRALIVDDEILCAMGLEAELHDLGFEVCDLASNGHQACVQAMSNKPDVVFMDVSLEGGREGIEVARWLNCVCEAPIVFVTGYTDADTIEQIHRRVPGAPIVAKPIYRGRLAEALTAAHKH